MIKKAEKTMLAHGMEKYKSILVGLSGGADSAALTHVLCALAPKYGFKVYAAHVNHCLRGSAADEDEEFSRRFAEKMGIDFFSLRVDVKAYANEHGMSEELAGRAVRYDFFEKLMKEHGIDCTATAHHRNDNAETILMNFMRGSGISGLCGIPYIRGRIIRPLLDVTRAEIEKYCEDNGIKYVTDATNLEEEYTRNKIRHTLIPLIEKTFNPSFTDTVTNNAAIIAREDDFISEFASEKYKAIVKDGCVPVQELVGLHPAIGARIIRMMTESVCGKSDVPSKVIDSVLELAENGKTGTRADIARGAQAFVEYGKLYIAYPEKETEPFSYKLEIGKKTYIPELGKWFLAETADERKGDGEYFSVPDFDENGILDVEIRSRRAGDVFIPSGMRGRKKLKDYMIDAKIPRFKRDRVGILTFNGKIAWIIGHRRAEGFKFHKYGIKISILS